MKIRKCNFFFFNQQKEFTCQHCYAFYSANWQSNENWLAPILGPNAKFEETLDYGNKTVSG